MWYLFALTSAVFSAIAAITQKKVLLKEKAISFTTILAFFNLIIAIPFFFFIDFSTLSTPGILILLLKSFLGATSFLFDMLGIKNLELSRALPLLVLTPGLVAIFSFILIGENLSITEILGISLLIAGTYIFSLKRKKMLSPRVKPNQKRSGPYP